MNPNTDKFGGIYVHIPYCVQKCPYCDFYSSVERSSVPVFLEALDREIELAGGMDLVFDTLYIGGGTPSVLAPVAIARLIEAIHRHFKFHSDVEATLEVNPGTVTRDSLAHYRRVRDEIRAFVETLQTGLPEDDGAERHVRSRGEKKNHD